MYKPYSLGVTFCRALLEKTHLRTAWSLGPFFGGAVPASFLFAGLQEEAEAEQPGEPQLSPGTGFFARLQNRAGPRATASLSKIKGGVLS